MTPAPPLASPPPPGRLRAGSPHRPARRLGYLAAAGLGSSVLIMIAVSAAGPSGAVVSVPGVLGGRWLPVHPSVTLVTITLWVAAAAGTGGLIAGLAAVAHGARPPARLLVVAALAVAAVLAVLPAAGSTDTLDYAAYGRMVALGHNPYLMTPLDLRLTGDPVGVAAPSPWQGDRSVYGPLASLEQGGAAELGGSSPARIVFWLKVWNALAFALVVLLLDRLMRADPARRARAHLLWSVNPLLLWTLVASGHVDTIAAALGLAGVLLVTPAMVSGGPARRGLRHWQGLRHWRDLGYWRGLRERRSVWLPGLAAGALVGLATDVKITFVVFGLGIAYAARRSRLTLAAVGAGALAVLGPSYLWFGQHAISVVFDRHTSSTTDNLYQLLARPFGSYKPPGLMFIVVPLLIGVGWLMVRRLPDGRPRRPAVQPVLAFSLAWLLVWPYQRPWYDAMAMCLLAIYPATRLDWPVLARLAAVTFYSLPGMPGWPSVHWLASVQSIDGQWPIPGIRLACLAAVIVLALTGGWRMAGPARPATSPAARVPQAVTGP